MYARSIARQAVTKQDSDGNDSDARKYIHKWGWVCGEETSCMKRFKRDQGRESNFPLSLLAKTFTLLLMKGIILAGGRGFAVVSAHPGRQQTTPAGL